MPVGGHLGVGTNEQGEVVINLDHDRTGHIIFSPAQARHLAVLMFRKAEEAVGASIDDEERPNMPLGADGMAIAVGLTEIRDAIDSFLGPPIADIGAVAAGRHGWVKTIADVLLFNQRQLRLLRFAIDMTVLD